MFSALRHVGVVTAVAVLFATGCANPDDRPADPSYEDIVPDEPGRGPIDDATTELEFEVYQELEYNPYEKAIRYDPETDELLVTIWTYGDQLLGEHLEELYERATGAANGAEVYIALVDDEGESEYWTP